MIEKIVYGLPKIYEAARKVFECGTIELQKALVSERAKGNIILDAGSGTGIFAEILKRKSKVIALDKTKSMLRFVKENERANFSVLADLSKLPFKSGSISTVAACCVLHHLKNLRVIVKEIVKSLRRGGRVIILDIRKSSDLGYWINSYLLDISAPKSTFDVKGWKRLLKRAGIKNLDAVKFRSFIFPRILISGDKV